MGVSTRPYMQRPIDPPTTTGTVPTWCDLADALRVRLLDVIEHAPITSVQEASDLADALAVCQTVYGRGQVYDRERP